MEFDFSKIPPSELPEIEQAVKMQNNRFLETLLIKYNAHMGCCLGGKNLVLWFGWALKNEMTWQKS